MNLLGKILQIYNIIENYRTKLMVNDNEASLYISFHHLKIVFTYTNPCAPHNNCKREEENSEPWGSYVTSVNSEKLPRNSLVLTPYLITPSGGQNGLTHHFFIPVDKLCRESENSFLPYQQPLWGFVFWEVWFNNCNPQRLWTWEFTER